jgi:Na+-translocating ferredoxin:NAD+ oxidoreductase RnfG subunit
MVNKGFTKSVSFRTKARNLVRNGRINEISPQKRRHQNGILFFGIICTTLFTLSIQSSHAKVFKTQQKALQEAFPNSDSIERKVLFLTDEQVNQIQTLAKAKLESKIVTFYVGEKADSITGYAFFESNIVRTKPETFMVVLDKKARVKFVEVLAFYEPLDYLPTSNWFALFTDKILSDKLWPKRDIHNITGATLSVQAITQGVRKMLAIYQVVIAKGKLN